ncbi:MAG TPA: glycosyltransferase, partial [Ilumatobacteraceae bacterium]|nr:glycosyltransferase [Ilumatobacteraceae bacterium]
AVVDRLAVVENGIDASATVAGKYPHNRRVVAVGRLVDQKGFDVLIRAFSGVVRDVPDAELVIVGDGHRRGELERLVAAGGVMDRVEMCGALPHADIAGLLASAAVVAMPSRFEGLPLVALEASLAGRPLVATPVQGLGDVVVDGVTGLVVPVEDDAALAAALV